MTRLEEILFIVIVFNATAQRNVLLVIADDIGTDYFGCYEDIIHTSFSIQHDNACFIDSTNVKRKDELERIMRFEIIKKLGEIANSKYNKDKAVNAHIKKKIKNDEIVEIKKAKTQSAKLLIIITADKDYAKMKIKQLHETILEISKKLHT